MAPSTHNESSDNIRSFPNPSQKKKQTRTDWLMWLIPLILLAYIGVQLVNQQMTLRMLRDQTRQVQEKIDETNGKIDQLTDQLDQSDSPAFIERKARENLGMVRADEWMFVDINDKRFDNRK